MNPFLHIRNLNLFIKQNQKKIHALKSLNFDLHLGECLGIVGESGSGKSLTAQAIACLSSHSIEGSIILEDQNLLLLNEKQKREVRRKIGMIFQNPQSCLNPTLKVGEQIREVDNRMTKEDVYDLLLQVQLNDTDRIYNSYPFELSGGMCQRIMIAMALAKQPHLIVADEPTTALDRETQTQILDLMKSIQKSKNTGILLITHDFDVIEKICDKVLVMYAGEIIEAGSVAEVLKNPLHPYTKALLASRPKLGGGKKYLLNAIRGQPPKIESQFVGCSFASRCPSSLEHCAKSKASCTAFGNHQVTCWHYL